MSGVSARLVTAIVAAGGSGRRLRGETAKPFVRLGAQPLLAHTVEVLQRMRCIDRIIVVAQRSHLDRARRCVRHNTFSKVKDVVAGGPTRAESVRRGLAACGPDTGWVVVHDAARPFITARQVEDCLRAARRHGAAVSAIPCSSTIKTVGRRRLVTGTLNRKELWEAQTPQIFRYGLLRQAYARACDMAPDRLYDDASVVERLPHPVAVVPSSTRNMKITTAEDLRLARLFVKQKNWKGNVS